MLGLSLVGWFICGFLNIVVFFLARSDKKEIQEGRMDLAGAGLTNTAYYLAIVNVVLAVVATCGYVIFMVAMAAGSIGSQPGFTQPTSTVDPSSADPGTGGSAPAAGGDACAKAKACCEAIYSQPMFAGQGAAACQSIDNARLAGAQAEGLCTQMLGTFKQAGAALPGGLPAACN